MVGARFLTVGEETDKQGEEARIIHVVIELDKSS